MSYGIEINWSESCKVYRNFGPFSSWVWSNALCWNTMAPREVVMWNQRLLVEGSKKERRGRGSQTEDGERWRACFSLPINNFEKLLPFFPLVHLVIEEKTISRWVMGEVIREERNVAWRRLRCSLHCTWVAARQEDEGRKLRTVCTDWSRKTRRKCLCCRWNVALPLRLSTTTRKCTGK
jgi:hypothetical protein